MNGPRWVGLAALGLGAMYALLLAVHGAGEEGLRVVVRATARTSLLLFSAAFAASSLQRLHPSAGSAWLLRNRRYVGLSFAVSHALHAGTLGWLAQSVPRFQTDAFTLIGGGFAYLMISAMAATSNDAAVARLGRRRWRNLHRFGGYTVWTIFAFDYVALVFQSLFYLPFAVLVAAVLGLRIAAAQHSRRRVPAPA